MEDSKYFHFKNARIARNIWDLKRELEIMPDAEYSEHVNLQKNDFSSWIENCVGDKMLADKIKTASNRKEAVLILKAKIGEITSEIGKSHVVSDFELIKDFLIGLSVGLVIGISMGIWVF